MLSLTTGAYEREHKMPAIRESTRLVLKYVEASSAARFGASMKRNVELDCLSILSCYCCHVFERKSVHVI